MKSLRALSSIILCLGIMQCNKTERQIDSKWTMQQLELNGMTLKREMLGNSYWQFEGNKYQSVMLGANDAGKYRINEDTLFLKSETTPQRPETVYMITNADSSSLQLRTNTNNNLSTIDFVRAVNP